jgi:hypothetical protein
VTDTRPGLRSRADTVGQDWPALAAYLATQGMTLSFHQLHLRYRSGATADPRYAEFGELADGILEFAHTVAVGGLF